MNFVLIECRPLIDFPPHRQWRATHVTDDDTVVDVFFWTLTIESARQHIRNHYPSAIFSDEVLQ